MPAFPTMCRSLEAAGLDGRGGGVTQSACARVEAAPGTTPGESMISTLFARLFGAARKFEDANERLRREVAAHEATLRELETARREFERRVAERTKELSLMTARFETALRGAKVHVFSQDRDLRYTWVYTPHAEASGAQLLGHTDEEILAAADRDSVVAMKRRVLATGTPEDCEVAFVSPDGRTLFALHADPMISPDGAIDGIMCAAVDISHTRSLESEQRRLTEELRTVVQRYETALRGSNVTVFTQDRGLTYTSISNPMFGREIDEILGRTDAEILPATRRAEVIAVKRRGRAGAGSICMSSRCATSPGPSSASSAPPSTTPRARKANFTCAC